MTELVTPEGIKTENTTPVQTEIKPITNQDNALPEETPQDRDWRKWRENRAKEREEALRIDEARKKAEKEAQVLREALEAVVNKPNDNRYASQNRTVDNDDIEESEEARIDKRVAQAIAKKEAEYERQRQERDQQEYPTKLRQTFKDFDQVCTPENTDYLEFHHPELAKSLGRMPMGFERFADIYSAIKRYVPNPDSKKDSQKADRNLQKPQSLSHSSISTGGTALTPVKLTEQRRKENWERMQRQLKGLS